MKDRRTHVFFWLGVFVLPVFWSWFTLSSSYTKKERGIAFSWLVFFLILLAIKWNQFQDRFAMIAIVYPFILAWLTLALWGWLFFRMRLPVAVTVLILFNIIGISPLFETIERMIGKPFSATWLLWPLVPAVLHLLVDPIKFWIKRFSRNSTSRA